MGKNVLMLDDVRKSIKGKEIVKRMSFSLDEGEILGFLGPNGAGKSTTLRMIVGLSKPTGGNIEIDGYSIRDNYKKAMQRVGCIIEGPDLYNFLSGYENLKMLGSMSKNVEEDDILRAAELVGMQNRLHDKVSTYSLGMKQRLGLAQALIHKPKLLILDEPTNGMDPAGINEFRNIIRRLAKNDGLAVLVSSHLISEVELMCDKVVIINNGELIKYSSVSEMIRTQEVCWILSDNLRGLELLKRAFGIKGIIRDERLEAPIDMDILPDINQTFIKEELTLKFVYNKHRTLEDLFLDLTGGETVIK